MKIEIEELNAKMEPMVENLGFELAETSTPVVGGRHILRLFIFSPGGVTLDDCARVSRTVSDLLDTEETIEEKFNLEVSSLGLDRPLVTPRDFERRIGERVKVTFDEEKGSGRVKGILEESNDSFIKIRTEKKTVTIPVEANPSGKILL
ncbi:MAG: ribosome maturation factor RimP [candidate division Zixibacteria bacterium]